MTDMSKFEGQGLSFKAKLIGVEEVPEARGDQMCQEALLRLKNSVKISKEHKQKIMVNVTLEGLKIMDAVTLALLHSHEVHRISFISRDTTDSRAFGYIYGDKDNTHKFFAIKTAAAAEQLVYTIRDLFQAVYDLKKQEMETAKQKMENGEVTTDGEGNSQTPGTGSPSGDGQTPQTTANADPEGIYQVPTNNAPVHPAADQAANLLDLEDQTEHILKGIEQIKNLDFESIKDEQPVSPLTPPTNPLANLASPAAATATADPWGFGATSTPAAAPASSSGSALGDLAGLHTSPFPTMPGLSGMPTAMPGQPFPGQPFGAPAGYGYPAARPGLPVTSDPFGNDPFSAPRTTMPAMASPANPFAATAGAQGFPPNPMFGAQPRMAMPGVPGMPYMPGQPAYPPGAHMPGQMMPGMPGQMMPPGMPGQPQANPFGAFPGAAVAQAPQQDPNLLQPMKKDDGQSENSGENKSAFSANRSSSNDLFGDLVDIKKTPAANTASNPKELFALASNVEKKSMNAMMKEGTAPPPANQNSPFADPFGSPQKPVNGNANNEQSLFG